MASRRPHLLTVVLVLGIGFLPGWAQELDQAWEGLVALDNRLEAARETEAGWIRRQGELEAEIATLRENQSWYNGWISELRLARRSARQVELADSLQALRERIATLEKGRDQAFRRFRGVYQHLLLVGDTLSVSEKERALDLGLWVMGRRGGPVELPDYSAIVEGPYEKEPIKRLVYQDLQGVLEGKLALIDSLVVERELEVTLLRRLNEFHQDLSVQQRTGLDLGSTQPSGGAALSPDESGETFATGGYDQSMNEGKRSGAFLEPTLDEEQAFSDELSFSEGLSFSPLTVTPAEEELRRLKAKRRQYLDLLQRIHSRLESR